MTKCACKNETKVWQMSTNIEAKKRGPARYLSLTGKTRVAVRDIKPTELGGNNGVEIILLKLDWLFLEDHNTRAYTVFKEFYEHNRSSGKIFLDFIIRFAQPYICLVKYDVILLGAAQSYFLLIKYE